MALAPKESKPKPKATETPQKPKEAKLPPHQRLQVPSPQNLHRVKAFCGQRRSICA